MKQFIILAFFTLASAKNIYYSTDDWFYHDTTSTEVIVEESDPVHCVVSDYGPWSECPSTCGLDNYRYRERDVILHPQNGGQSCPTLRHSLSCESDPCPVDCDVTEWTDWTDCTATCGGGFSYRKRGVLQAADFGGSECLDKLLEVNACNTQKCVEGCQVSLWSDWGDCDAECNQKGHEKRRREVVQWGDNCPSLKHQRNCEKNCAFDCQVSQWGSWGSCSQSCNGGFQRRTRTVLYNPSRMGNSCPILEEASICNAHPPLECAINAFRDPFNPCVCVCPPGMAGNPHDVFGLCVPYDICLDIQCPLGSLCVANPTGYSCECAPGFKKYGPKCKDIDECLKFPCGHKAVCKNQHGGFDCVCPPGTQGDPFRSCNVGDIYVPDLHSLKPEKKKETLYRVGPPQSKTGLYYH